MSTSLREYSVGGFLVVARSPESALSAVVEFVDRASEAGLNITPFGIVSAFPIGEVVDVGPSQAYTADHFAATMQDLAKSHT